MSSISFYDAEHLSDQTFGRVIQVEKIRLGLKDDRELSQKLDLTHLKVSRKVC